MNQIPNKKKVGALDFFCLGFGAIVGVGWAVSINSWMASCGGPVPAAAIVDKAVELNADLIGTSALLTTTMGEMKVLEDLLKEKGLKDRFKTLVGGAPVTERFAKRIGADAYGEDASQAVSEVVRLLG